MRRPFKNSCKFEVNLEQLRQREELHESKERVGYRESKKKEVSLEEQQILSISFVFKEKRLSW